MDPASRAAFDRGRVRAGAAGAHDGEHLKCWGYTPQRQEHMMIPVSLLLTATLQVKKQHAVGQKPDRDKKIVGDAQGFVALSDDQLFVRS